MGNLARNVAILGAAGSIGRNTLDVVQAAPGHLKVVGLTANTRLTELCRLAQDHQPRWVVATDAEAASRFDWSGMPRSTELLYGPDAVQRLVMRDDVDVVVAAIVGSAGLRGTWSA